MRTTPHMRDRILGTHESLNKPSVDEVEGAIIEHLEALRYYCAYHKLSFDRLAAAAHARVMEEVRDRDEGRASGVRALYEDERRALA